MSKYPGLAKCGLILVASFSLAASAQATCIGPKLLEAQTHTHPGVESFTSLGKWFGDHRQYGCAADAFRSALKFEPKSGQLLYLMGLSLYTAGETDRAVDALQQSIQIFPRDVRAHLILAASLAQLHQTAEAIVQWKIALQLDPGSKVALDGLSKSFIVIGDYAATIALLQATPLDENLALNLALAYANSEMLDQAADTLKKALQTNPSSRSLTSALTTIYVNQTRYQEAVRTAEKAAKLNPRDVEAQRLYLRVLVLNSEFALARPLGQKLLAASPHDFEFLYLNGILEREAREYTTARGHLQEAIALNPNHYNSRYNLALVLDQLKDFSGAKEQLEKALTLRAIEPGVRFEYSKVLRSLGETQAAQEQLKLYQQELKQNEDRAFAAGKAARAEEEYASGDPQRAVALYREALDATPRNALLAYKLALALDRTGDVAAETAVLQQAIQIDPSLALAQNQLGYLESRGGDTASAEEHFRLAVRAAPGYTQAWVSLAATLGMESRFAEAQEALSTALQLDPNNADALQLRKALSDALAKH